MDIRNKIPPQIYFSSLTIQYSEFDVVHHFEVRKNKLHDSFGLILEGNVEFSLPDKKICATAGDIVYLPEGIRYVSHWSGNPKIRFISIHFQVQHMTQNIWRSFPLQCINHPNQGIIDVMLKMKDQNAQDTQGYLKSLSMLYELCAEIFPYLDNTCNVKFPEHLQHALQYIDENYTNISSIDNIAKACFISESHLYHLFQKHFNTTPISYINNLKIQKAVELLQSTDHSVQQIANDLNFHSEYYFRKTFIKIMGVLPSKFRKLL